MCKSLNSYIPDNSGTSPVAGQVLLVKVCVQARTPRHVTDLVAAAGYRCLLIDSFNLIV
jgi:hypothetical protein